MSSRTVTQLSVRAPCLLPFVLVGSFHSHSTAGSRGDRTTGLADTDIRRTLAQTKSLEQASEPTRLLIRCHDSDMLPNSGHSCSGGHFGNTCAAHRSYARQSRPCQGARATRPGPAVVDAGGKLSCAGAAVEIPSRAVVPTRVGHFPQA